MLRPAFFALIVLAWIFVEFHLRKKRGLAPQNFRQLIRLSQKTSAASPFTPPFVFAFLTFLFFAFWEGTLRNLLHFRGHPIFTLLGLTLLFVFLSLRLRALSLESRSPMPSQWQLGIFILATALFLPSPYSLLLAPWLWLRSRHLPQR